MARANRGGGCRKGGTSMLNQRPTMVDVAREAGVSRSLVSLVLQNPEKVSPARQKLVREAMEKLGYRPNAAARALTQRRTDILGVLVSDLHNPFYTEVIDGIQEAIGSTKQRMLIASGDRDPVREHEAATKFIELRVDGLVLITPRLSNDVIEALAAEVPVAIVGRPGEGPSGCSRVRTDDAVGIALAIDHLVSLGHERIAHVSAGDNPGARARLAAYRDEMQRRGLDRHIRVATAVPTQQGGFEGAHELLASGERPTAIIASNDFAALGVLGAAQSAGLRCPDDISVVGYDNSIFAQLEPVQLTTINQPRFSMGLEVVRALREQIADGVIGDVALEPELVVRRTTGPA